MNSKLLLSLWILGGLLYAGSTVFLAHAVLGGPSADKAKSTTIAAAGNAQCAKDSVAATDADPMKTAAIEPKTAAEPQKPAQPAAKPETAGTATPDTTEPSPEADGEAQPSGAASEPSQDDASQDEAGMPQGEDQSQAPWDQDQAGMQGNGEDPEADDWAHVIAGTADMRSEPSLEAPLIYALPAGWQVRVISREPGWVQVQDANSGAAGWVEATAIAPGGGPNVRQGAGGYPPRQYGDPNQRYADEGYPYAQPRWRERRRERRGEFADFLRRALGGF